MDEQPSSADAFGQQAFYFIERRRLADAKRVLKDGLSQFPQDPDLLYYGAQVEWLDDENDAAEATVRQVLSVAPEHAPARQLLASLLAERNQFADAEVLLIGLLRDYPEDAGLYGRYSRLMLRRCTSTRLNSSRGRACAMTPTTMSACSRWPCVRPRVAERARMRGFRN